MRVIFAGTPAAAVPTLEALIASKHEVCAVITRPPARVGRGRKVAPSPVALIAAEHGVELIEASSMRDEELHKQIEMLQADLGVVVAYGALIPQKVLDLPALGWVNLHFSDLPRWRGAAPVQRAIFAGDAVTASCIFQLEKGLDTGPVFSREYVEITHETSDQLLERMSISGAAQMVRLLDEMESGNATAIPQDTGPDDENITLAPMLHPVQGFISFDESVTRTDQHIRAFTSNPGAWTTLPNGQRMKLDMAIPADSDLVERVGAPSDAPTGALSVHKNTVMVRCADGWLQLGRVAPAGKGMMDAGAWARGARLAHGDRLGRPLPTENTAGEGEVH